MVWSHWIETHCLWIGSYFCFSPKRTVYVSGRSRKKNNRFKHAYYDVKFEHVLAVYFAKSIWFLWVDWCKFASYYRREMNIHEWRTKSGVKWMKKKTIKKIQSRHVHWLRFSVSLHQWFEMLPFSVHHFCDDFFQIKKKLMKKMFHRRKKVNVSIWTHVDFFLSSNC